MAGERNDGLFDNSLMCMGVASSTGAQEEVLPVETSSKETDSPSEAIKCHSLLAKKQDLKGTSPFMPEVWLG